MKRYPKTVEDSYIDRYLKKWRKRIRAAKEGHPYLSLYNPDKEYMNDKLAKLNLYL